MKVVYLWKDGQQVLVFKNSDGEYEYPNEKWTEQGPPEGIYAPFYFDGQKWIGQSQEDFKKTLEPVEEEFDEKDMAIAQLTGTVAELTDQVELLQVGLAQLTKEQANIKLEAE